MQAAFAEMLNSPGQMQRLLAALSAQQNFQIPDPMPPPDAEPPPVASSSQLTSYDPNLDFTRGFPEDPHSVLGYLSPSDLLASSSLKGPDTIAPYDPLAHNAARLQKTYKDAQEIDKDVNALHMSITSLIESLGLDPDAISAPPTQDGIATGEPAIDTSSLTSGMDMSHDDPTTTDFDFLGTFLNGFSGDTDYGDQVDSTAFLDEVNSDAASPVSLRHDTPVLQTTKPSRKRNSDVAELDRESTKSTNNSGPKKKR
jgi:hypothetical protein